MKKILVAYYSRSGTTKILANLIAKKLNADIDEITDLSKRRGPIGWIKSGKDASQKKFTEIKCNIDPSKYSLVVIGGPVWAGTVSPAIRTYLTKEKENLAEVAFFSTAGSSKSVGALGTMEELTKKPVFKINFDTKEVSGKVSKNVNEFIAKLKV